MKKLNFFLILATFGLSANFSFAQTTEQKIKDLQSARNSIIIYDNDPLNHFIDSTIEVLLDKKIKESFSSKELKQCYVLTAGSKRMNVFGKLVGQCKNEKDVIKLSKFVKKSNYFGYYGPEYYSLAKKKVDIISGKSEARSVSLVERQ